MATLSDEYKKRCRWHLFGTGAGVSIRDRQRLEKGMDNISEVAKSDIEKLIDQCDKAFLEINTSREYVKKQNDSYFTYVSLLAEKLYTSDLGVLNGCSF